MYNGEAREQTAGLREALDLPAESIQLSALSLSRSAKSVLLVNGGEEEEVERLKSYRIVCG